MELEVMAPTPQRSPSYNGSPAEEGVHTDTVKLTPAVDQRQLQSDQMYYVDPLPYQTYAKCITRVLSDPHLPTPLTLGIFGKWGTGKTTLVRGILWNLKQACGFSCDSLDDPVAPSKINWVCHVCCCKMSFFAALTLLLILYVFVTAAVTTYMIMTFLGVKSFITGSQMVNETTPAVIETTTIGSVIPSLPDRVGIPVVVAAAFMLLVLILFILFGVASCCDQGPLTVAGSAFTHFKILVLMAMCDTPEPPPADSICPTEIIPVCFNAWEYAGTDKLWAAIILRMFEQTEKAFGKWKTRFYRICTKDMQHEHDYMLGSDDLWWTLASQADLTGSSIAISNGETAKLGKKTRSKMGLLQSSLVDDLTANTTEQDSRDVLVRSARWHSIPYPVLVFAGISAITVALIVLIILIVYNQTTEESSIFVHIFQSIAGGVLGIAVVVQLRNIINILSSLFTSQATRLEGIRKVTQGPDFTKDLGFMHEVKEEVKLLMGYLRVMEHLYQKRFRLLVLIDDLDKCGDGKILEILDAVSLLLSDDDAPIISIIDIDPLHVMKALARTGKNGQMYLSKMIKMRFCLPDINISDIECLLQQQTEHLRCSIVKRFRTYQKSRLKRSVKDLEMSTVESKQFETLLPKTPDYARSESWGRSSALVNFRDPAGGATIQGVLGIDKGQGSPGQTVCQGYAAGDTDLLISSKSAMEGGGTQHHVRIKSVRNWKSIISCGRAGSVDGLPSTGSYELDPAYADFRKCLTTTAVNGGTSTTISQNLRRCITLLAVNEVRCNADLLDRSYLKISNLFYTIFLSSFVWVEKLKQLNVMEDICDPALTEECLKLLYETCRELTDWLLLCEQWPYRSSWLLHEVDSKLSRQSDQSDISVKAVYEEVKDRIATLSDLQEWNELDCDEHAFIQAIERFQTMSAGSIRRYVPFTVNIDRSIKEAICDHDTKHKSDK